MQFFIQMKVAICYLLKPHMLNFGLYLQLILQLLLYII